MNGVLERRAVRGLVYGESSVFHIYLEAPGAKLPVACSEDYRWLDAVTLKSMNPGIVRALQNGFRVRGIELLSYNGGMTSAAHEDQDIDETVAAFDDLVGELLDSGRAGPPVASDSRPRPRRRYTRLSGNTRPVATMRVVVTPTADALTRAAPAS